MFHQWGNEVTNGVAVQRRVFLTDDPFDLVGRNTRESLDQFIDDFFDGPFFFLWVHSSILCLRTRTVKQTTDVTERRASSILAIP